MAKKQNTETTVTTETTEIKATAEYVPSKQEQYFADNNTGVTAELNENVSRINQEQANEDYWSANGQR